MSPDRLNDSRNLAGRPGGTTRDIATSQIHAVSDVRSNTVRSDKPASSSELNHTAEIRSASTPLASQFEADLAQKDELIAALVQELEQAADKLDRLERSGADRSNVGYSSPSQSLAHDLRSNQSADLDDLRQMAEEWQETKPGSMLTRIESQLAAVHDLVLSLKRDDRARSDPAEIDDRIRRIYRETDQTIVSDATDVTLNDSTSAWESIKQQILGGDNSSDQSTSPPPEDSELLQLMNETPAPVIIDLNSADVEELKVAIAERDAYIIQLNRLYRSRNSLSLPTDWAALANVPAEMQIRVDTLVQRLDVQVRLGEVEMSLERARLARERSHIQSEREQIEKHLRRLGLNSIADLNSISSAPGNTSDRRWMRFLGPNTK